jgi:hypothetical protein
MPGSRGNRNALKHGFYASLWTVDELVGLKKAGEINDVNGEINLLRVVIRRIAKTIPQEKCNTSFRNHLDFEFGGPTFNHCCSNQLD